MVLNRSGSCMRRTYGRLSAYVAATGKELSAGVRSEAIGSGRSWRPVFDAIQLGPCVADEQISNCGSESTTFAWRG